MTGSAAQLVNATGVLLPAQRVGLSLPSLPGAKLYPKFPGARIRFSGYTLLAFKTGSLVMVGVQNLTTFTRAKQEVQNYLRSCGYEDLTIEDVKITNLVYAGSTGFQVDLAAFHAHLKATSQDCFYEAELYPAVRLWKTGGAALLVYRTGKVILTGMRDDTLAQATVAGELNLLNKFKV